MRHRIAQRSAPKTNKDPRTKLAHVETIFERYLEEEPLRPFWRALQHPHSDPCCMGKRGRMVRAIEIGVRLKRISGWILDRYMIGVLNIGLRAIAPNRRPVAPPRHGPEVWAKLVNPHQGSARTSVLLDSLNVLNPMVLETLS